MDVPSLLEVQLPQNIRDTSAQDVVLDQTSRLQRRRRAIIAASALGVVFLALSAFAIRSWTSTTIAVPRDRVRIAAVSQGQFIRDVAAEGTIVAANSPTLFAAATGIVTVDVVAGDKVSKGQALGTVESPALRNEYAREQATLESLDVGMERQRIEIRRQMLQNRQATDQASVQIRAAEREFERSESAFNQGVIAKRDYDKARDEVEAARLVHQHALATGKLQDDSLEFELKTKMLERSRQKLTVDNLARRVSELTIRSPVNGVVGSIAVNQRATIVENAPILTVVDLSAFEIEFRVPESYASALGLNMTAEITYGGKLHKGNVTSISPEVQGNEVKGRVRFAEQTPSGLRQNQRVNLRVIMDSRDNVLKVERGAFVDAGSVAYLVQGDAALRKPVVFGAMSMGEVEIVSGLAAGDQIVVSNVNDFNDAAEIRLSD